MIVKVLVAAALVAAPISPAVPQTKPVAIPADMIARAKFPTDDPKLIDRLAAINLVVNALITPESDQEHYGVPDLWVMAPRDWKGDCEDYAITKYYLIENDDNLSIDPVKDMKLVPVMVHFGKESDGHGILAVRLPSGDVMYLDNFNREPMTRFELVGEGYQFFDWRA